MVMTMKQIHLGRTAQEVIFQLIFHALVFVFYSYNRKHPGVEEYQVVFFLAYAFAAFIINYFLLPRFFYKKKYLFFFLGLVLILTAIILTEEFVLEQIYFPDTRGHSFPGLFFTLWGILPVITILSGFKFAWDALGKERELDNLKTLMRESELQFLKSQINPHFLFNNLNNLYSYALINSPKTTEIILELSSVLRYMLYECQEDVVSLAKEVKQIENFISLSEMQIEERGQVRFTQKNISSNYQIAPLILIVFIENAFKHSTASQSDNISIEVHLEMSGDNLIFVCKNSFLEESNTQNLSKGIGLENVKKRLNLLYPNSHQLEILKGENLYEVRLSILLTNNEINEK